MRDWLEMLTKPTKIQCKDMISNKHVNLGDRTISTKILRVFYMSIGYISLEDGKSLRAENVPMM